MPPVRCACPSAKRSASASSRVIVAVPICAAALARNISAAGLQVESTVSCRATSSSAATAAAAAASSVAASTSTVQVVPISARERLADAASAEGAATARATRKSNRRLMRA